MNHEAERATEDYNLTRIQLKSIKIRLKASRAQLAVQEHELTRAQKQLGLLAAETYRRGDLSGLDLLLGDDPSAALSQAGFLPTLSDRQATATNQLRLGQVKLARVQAMMKIQQQRDTTVQDRLRASRKAINRKLAEATAQVNRLKGSELAALNRDQNTSASAGVPAGAGIAFCNAKAGAAPTAATRTALTFACAQLGKPYLWAGDGPGSYDCSGLTMKAYAAAGISLPHSSQLQAGYGTQVSVSSLRPGDLVFFDSPIGHEGIYLGAGLMVHAPKSGDVVRMASLYQTPSDAVRL